ncbi:EAL domain-containing protein [Thauera sp.]|uniref:EAL domain-containing protein n=1 Tax=Thauera sp. TaxID=1905334 RepID=UPI002C07CFD4|nr:EAL domain-containing protein [Thauera sp.]HRP23177.1 EAL domain-containing protein [Thauera sp.]
MMSAIMRMLALIAGLCALQAPAFAAQALTLGIFAHRPKVAMEQAWTPFVAYLNANLDGVAVRLRVLEQTEMKDALTRGELDLVLTNPAHFVALRVDNALSGAIATQVNNEHGVPVGRFGGVIVVRKDNAAIRTLADLGGRLVGTTSANFLGTFAAQAHELLSAGVAPRALRLKTLTQYQDRVIDAVLSGEVEAGFVRTGLIEELTREGRTDLHLLEVINRRELPGFPYASSTGLYPEWPLVALPHADEAAVRRIASLALMLPADHPAARAAGIHGFTVPADYSVVEDLLRTLRLPPFDTTPSFTWHDVLVRYQLWFFILGLAVVTILLLLARVAQSHHQLVRAHQQSRRLAEQIDLEHHYLSNVVEAAGAASWELELARGEYRVDRRWADMLGLAPEDSLVLDRAAWRAMVHPDDVDQFERGLARHIAGELPCYEQDLRLRHRDGRWLWVHDRGHVVTRAPDGSALLLIGAQLDISRRKLNEEKLRLAASVFASSYEAILITDADNRIIDANPAFTRITGFTRDEVIGQTPALLNSGRQGREFYRNMWSSLHETDHWQGELWNRRKDGTEFAEMLSISRVRDGDGRVMHHVALFSDISHLKLHEEELNRIAYFDPLTGAPNRRLLDDRLRQAIAHARRTGKALGVCVIDLDGFKPINDQYGHEAGDRLLVEIVDRLNGLLRASDTVARLGGDEFVLLLEDMDGTAVLARVLEAIRQPMQFGRDRVSVSASIGVTCFPEDDVDPDTLLRHADQAMYRAKQRGRDCIQHFDTTVEQHLANRQKRCLRLEQALREREFVLHYQPQVDMPGGRMIGAEALIRWQHPEQGLLAPAHFLPDVEGTELEAAIGEWVMDSALNELERWREAGLDISVSINVGANHLLKPGFVDTVRSALQRHPGIPPARLELEILESTAIDDMVSALEVLHACRRLGIRLALDDFGTGYASLKHFRQLPVDLLKIDRSFVIDMLDDAEDRAIVQGVIQLAKAFGREVIAEGVETPAHAAALTALGCRLGQGFGIARPMPAAHVLGWVAWYTADARQWAEDEEQEEAARSAPRR